MKNTCDIATQVLQYVSTQEFGVGCCEDEYQRAILKAYQGRLACEDNFCGYAKQPCADFPVDIECNITCEITSVVSGPEPYYIVTFSANAAGGTEPYLFQWAEQAPNGFWTNLDPTGIPTSNSTFRMKIDFPSFGGYPNQINTVVILAIFDAAGCVCTDVSFDFIWDTIPCELCLYPIGDSQVQCILPLGEASANYLKEM